MYLGRRVELLLKNFIPTIYKVYTDFEYQLFDLKKFHELKSALYLNEERNNLIIDTINETL